MGANQQTQRSKQGNWTVMESGMAEKCRDRNLHRQSSPFASSPDNPHEPLTPVYADTHTHIHYEKCPTLQAAITLPLESVLHIES